MQVWACRIVLFSKKVKFVENIWSIDFVGLELMKSDLQDFQKYSSYIFSSMSINQRLASFLDSFLKWQYVLVYLTDKYAGIIWN